MYGTGGRSFVDRSTCDKVLDRLLLTCGLPAVIRVDNGPEFISKALDLWSYEKMDMHETQQSLLAHERCMHRANVVEVPAPRFTD